MIPALHGRTAAMLHRPRHRPHEGRGGAILAAMALASVLASLFWAAVSLALPRIHAELGASMTELQWTVTGAGLAFSASLILAGRLGDIHGRRRLLAVGCGLLGAAATLAALARDVDVLIGAVTLMGVAAAILTPVSLAVVTDAFGPDRRAEAIAVWGGAGALAYGLGPAVGGGIAHLAGWRWIFWLHVPLALLALGLCLAAVPRRSPRPAPVDVGGALLLAGGLGALSLGLTEGPSGGWASGRTLGLLGAGAVLLGAFGVREGRARSPLVDLRLLRIRAYVATNAVLFCVNFVLGTLLYFVPLYLEELRGDTPLAAGLRLVPFSGAILLAMPIGGRLAERGHARAAIVAGLGIAALGAWLLAGAAPSAGSGVLVGVLALLGAGVGLALTPINVTAMSAVPAESLGSASGVLATARGLGTAIGVAASGALFQILEVRQTVEAAGGRGVTLPSGTARALDGVLAGSAPAERTLHRLGADAAAVLDAARDGFASGLVGVLHLCAAVGLAALLLTVVVLRGRGAQESARPTTDTAIAATNAASSAPTAQRMTRSAGDA